MSFDPESKKHKALLYKAIVAAAKMAGEYFDDFLQEPFKKPWLLSPSSRRNLQRGEYASIRAKVLYEFIRDHHVKVGHSVAPEIFPIAHKDPWQDVLKQHATNSQPSLQLVIANLRLVPRDQILKTADDPRQRDQINCMHLSTELESYAIVLDLALDRFASASSRSGNKSSAPQSKDNIDRNSEGDDEDLGGSTTGSTINFAATRTFSQSLSSTSTRAIH